MAGNENDMATPAQNQTMPVMALLALAMTGFICIVTETIPAGLLPLMASGLDISLSLTGQMVTAYAAGSLIAAIPLTIATQNWRRRRVLLTTVVGFLLFNSLTAVSTSVTLTLVARFLAGASAGLAWSLLAGYARRMVPVSLQGKAMALAMVGTPVALSLGVPLGTWLGNILGWRLTFAVMSGLSVFLIIWIILAVPDFPGQNGQQKRALRQVFYTPGVRPVLGVVFSWMLAHNILYTYVAPFVTPAGLQNQIDLILLVFGLAALVGIFITGKIVDRHLRKAVLASLAVFALVSLLFGLTFTSPLVIYGGVAVWGMTFGGAATLLQTALADAAGEGADLALSMNVVVWNSAIAGGGIAGGVLLEHAGVASFPWVMLILLLVSFAIASAASAHGFTREGRQARSVAR